MYIYYHIKVILDKNWSYNTKNYLIPLFRALGILNADCSL